MPASRAAAAAAANNTGRAGAGGRQEWGQPLRGRLTRSSFFDAPKKAREAEARKPAAGQAGRQRGAGR